MENTLDLAVDKKFVVALVFVCLVLGGSFAFIYLDLKKDLEVLKRNYNVLSNQTQQLQNLLENQYYSQLLNITAVQIYNSTKCSVVLISCTLADGSQVQGSGFVYNVTSDGGYIVTNNHVVEDAVNIYVVFFDGKTVRAQLMGRDVYSDLAVIKVDELPEQSTPLRIGDSTKLMVGEPVYAIGNPFGLRGSMTAGIVSQLGRVIRLEELGVPEPWGKYSIADLIQFDAAVNPGNSGGPLLNGIGEVVGVTFAIETAGETPAFIGIGYAVPSVILKRVVPALIENGTYAHPNMGVICDRNYIGGMYIIAVDQNGPADKAGLKKDDIVIEVDGLPITCADDLLIYLERYKSPGDTIQLKVKRGDVEFTCNLTLGERKS